MATVDHETFTFERHTSASPERVYAAYADPAERLAWSAPTETAMFEYESEDFAEGGVDLFRCGAKEDPQYTGRATYAVIVPGERIVSTEVVTVSGTAMMATLNTVEIVPDGKGTLLRVTIQVASFVGAQAFDGVRQGNDGALDNLVAYVERKV